MTETTGNQGESDQRIQLADGRAMAYLQLGDPAGRPVLYCHGYPGSRLEARLAANAAGRLGLRLLAPDRPGFGASSFQKGRRLGDWAADVAELADRSMLERFDVVGVSGGGPYALACAAGFPERVTGLALVASLGPVTAGALPRDMALLNRSVLALAARCPATARLVVGILTHWFRREPDRYYARMLAGAPAADRRVLADAAYRRLLQESTAQALLQGGRGPAWDLTLLAGAWDFRLEDIRLPVRIWQGLADDIVPPAMARDLAARLPGSAVHFLPEEGHLSLIVGHLGDVLADLAAAPPLQESRAHRQ